MNYKSEDELKRALGIDSWRNLSRDKMIRFAAMMPDMDNAVALKLLEQFPVFTEFAVESVDAMERSHKSTIKANNQSQENVHQAYKEIREILSGELSKDDLNWEEKKYLIDQIQETGRQEFQKDSENKKFLDGLLGKVLLGVGSALTLGVVFVGGKVMAERLEGPDDSHEAWAPTEG